MAQCSFCGKSFDLEDAKREFNHYFSESSRWDYDEVMSEVMCADCAINDASSRWYHGELEDEFEGTYE